MPLVLPSVDTSGLLVTPEELAAAALSSLSLDVSGGAGTDDYDQAALALADAQERTERYLDRALLVSAVTERPYASSAYAYDAEWEPVPLGGLTAYRRPLREWPLVAVHADSAVTAAAHVLASDPTGRAVTVSTLPTDGLALVYYAGYRGRQHTLDGADDTTALTGLPGLSDLATLPPLVPADVRRSIEELALLFLNRARHKTLGTGRRTQQVGSGSTVTIEAADVNAETRILGRLAPHRRITV